MTSSLVTRLASVIVFPLTSGAIPVAGMASLTSSRTNSFTSSYPNPQPPGKNKATPPFRTLVDLFEKLRDERKQDTKRRLLTKWVNGWRQEVGNDFFPLLRLLLPHLDKERPYYGLKEASIATLYIDMFGLGKLKKNPESDASTLMQWRQPIGNATPGDFSSAIHDFAHRRSTVIEGTVSIKRVNDLLDSLANGAKDRYMQIAVLREIFEETTATEQKWIVRIILKDMAISVKEATIFSVFHPDAEDVYNASSDLRAVAWLLYDPEHRSSDNDKGLQLFRPFKPMLCKPLRTIEEMVKEMEGKEFFIEEKLDGERMQVHMQEGKYFYCSRKGTDYTYLYGKSVNTGSLTRHLAKALDERIENIILDGEMIAIDTETERVLPFGTLKEAASGKLQNAQPCFRIFDVLYFNGSSLLDKSVTSRKRNMRAYIKEVPGRVGFVTEYMGRTVDDVRTRLEEIMAARGEGLIIKHPLARYVLNGRNLDWVKVKPEHMDGMVETLDLLVVAGNYGSGKRGGKISTLLCAVKDDLRSGGNGPERYSTFVRVGSGLTNVQLDRITDMPWKRRGSKGLPEWLQTLKAWDDDKYDVYLELEDTFALEVKASEIIASDHHYFDYSLRFPRAMAIREDLSKDDCWTTSRILDYMRSDKKRKLDDTSKENASMQKKQKKAPKKVPYLLCLRKHIFNDDQQPEALPIYINPSVTASRSTKKNSDETYRCSSDKVVSKIEEPSDVNKVKGFDSSPDAEEKDVKLGSEDQAAICYDQDRIFKHLYFYLDSSTNAVRLGMAVRKKHEAAINESFTTLKKIILENGGEVVDLDDPKLTHIVLDKRDTGRQVKLRKITSSPKHRRLVVSTYIDACLAEGTLLNEEDFAP
ncbi:hypothetical protein GYMLUDRAFT_247050 [Collybiopsis luxurians FD-317 M1]|uniref:DNA ligase n=1 Tax=Collybiopsis luxurians FD-317 M1 TaxID=944289 RepID=A0A0D0B2N0_9AGAR|nr:hypothetical protein GYMLUDRAFT_247050 [Collybiopsis luxurians FD-317 M1]